MYFLWRRRKYYLLMLKLPGPLGLPLLGIALDLIQHKLKLSVVTKYYDNYGPTIFTWKGPLPFLIKCLKRISHVADALVANAGPGVLTLQEPFKHNVLLSFFPTFNAKTDDLLTLLDSYVNQGEKDVLHDVLRWSFRISFQTTVGANIQQEDSFENDTLLQSFQSGLKLLTLNSLFPFTQIEVIALLTGIEKQRAWNAFAMNPILDSIIQKKLSSKTKSNSDTEMNLVIDRAIDSFQKGHMALADMRGECIIMVVAGRFNPDHFLPESVRERHPYAYIPFSKRRRNCIGWRYALLSSRLSLAKILRNFKVSTSFRYEDLDFVENIGMKLVEEPRLAFTRRT